MLFMTTSFGTKPAWVSSTGWRAPSSLMTCWSLISGLVQPRSRLTVAKHWNIDRSNAGQHRRGWTHGLHSTCGVREFSVFKFLELESAVSNKSSRSISSSVVYLDPLVSCCLRRHSSGTLSMCVCVTSMYHPTCRLFLIFKEGMFNSLSTVVQGRKPCFPFVGHRAEFVHFIVNARSQETAVPQAQRCLLIQGVADGFHHLVELLEPLAQVHQERVLTVFAPLCDGRHSFQCVGRGDQINALLR